MSLTFQSIGKDTYSFAQNDQGTIREAAIGFELLRKTVSSEFDQLRERGVYSLFFKLNDGRHVTLTLRFL